MLVLITLFFSGTFNGILLQLAERRGLDYVNAAAVIEFEYSGSVRTTKRSIIITIPEASVASYMNFLFESVYPVEGDEPEEPADTADPEPEEPDYICDKCASTAETCDCSDAEPEASE